MIHLSWDLNDEKEPTTIRARGSMFQAEEPECTEATSWESVRHIEGQKRGLVWVEHREQRGEWQMSHLTGLCRYWAPPIVPTLRIGTAAPYWLITRAWLVETSLWTAIFRGKIPGPWEGKHGPSLHLLPLFPGNAFLCSLLPFFYPPSTSSSTHISKTIEACKPYPATPPDAMRQPVCALSL